MGVPGWDEAETEASVTEEGGCEEILEVGGEWGAVEVSYYDDGCGGVLGVSCYVCELGIAFFCVCGGDWCFWVDS